MRTNGFEYLCLPRHIYMSDFSVYSYRLDSLTRWLQSEILSLGRVKAPPMVGQKMLPPLKPCITSSPTESLSNTLMSVLFWEDPALLHSPSFPTTILSTYVTLASRRSSLLVGEETIDPTALRQQFPLSFVFTFGEGYSMGQA